LYPLSLLGNGSVKALLLERIHMQQWKSFGRVISYTVRAASKENMRLVLPRTSFLLLFLIVQTLHFDSEAASCACENKKLSYKIRLIKVSKAVCLV
jgi:hypothetical protein